MSTRGWQAVAVVAVGLALVTAGCTDTTVQPQSSITGANVFNDVNSYRAFLARVYSGLAVSGQQGAAGNPDLDPSFDEGFSQYLRLLWETEELPTDEAVIGWGDIGLPEMNTQLWSASSNMVVTMYYRVYFQVGMANEFLRQTTDEQLAARNVPATLKATIQTYRAEVRFLRALSYWHGVDLFGNIPLVTEATPLGSTPPKQNSRAEVYAYIVSELNAIKTQLPAKGADSYGRATPAAASMLLAKVQLNAQVYTGTPHFTEAMAAVNDVLNAGYALEDGAHWRRMFSADNNNSPELIFAIPQDGLKTQTWGGVTFLVHASCGGSMSNGDYGIDGCWWGIRLKPEAYNNFTAADARRSYFYANGQTVAIPNISDFAGGIAAPKFTNKTSTGANGSHSTFVDTDWPLFRLGDAYLMYAELVLRGGGGTRAQALTYVNALRARAGVPAWADADLTLDNILAERGRELLWEGHRRTDLVRFGKFTGSSYVWAWKGGTQAGTATQSFRDVYPLPANELVANPNLKQNTGY